MYWKYVKTETMMTPPRVKVTSGSLKSKKNFQDLVVNDSHFHPVPLNPKRVCLGEFQTFLFDHPRRAGEPSFNRRLSCGPWAPPRRRLHRPQVSPRGSGRAPRQRGLPAAAIRFPPLPPCPLGRPGQGRGTGDRRALHRHPLPPALRSPAGTSSSAELQLLSSH